MSEPRANAYFDHEHVTVIEPPRGWHMLDWRELWAYRELLWVLATRDIKVRYKQTVLGAAWAVIRPFTTMLIFSVVFGALARIPSDGLPYPIFVFAGLLPWTFFAGAISASGGSLVGSAHLVSKVYFPRLIIPLASVGAGLADLLVSIGILLLMMVWYGVPWTWQLLAAPLLLAALVFTALGVGTLLSALTVAYRDFTHLTPFLVQIWLYVTPVIFPVSIVPPRWQWLLYLNPMSGLVEGFRAAFLGRPFDLLGLSISFATAIAVFALGVSYFEKVERRFADII
ncbi:ABC transporter permease [Caenimonas aquaedulcis]|uniref:Transport permease protein n=1 Tax=Caenimonas aquaedulcis TaxID=2793270 RepID=A0A931MHS6_9BURK|nr:ABC transporter permease [Caenimonas aquaedulcis]MBG9389074.1 ABC transporter permease [Caenimonas aquaedulcis]